ncbi:histidine kinase [Chitinophaga sp. SYP-B3965]|uniref:sensor histidine kinase n=1 Tax=Chitinophaga sp. SYP-B3965 TaxID=2663120 RepID=UPI001299939B|nr:sensor histidine kinase [Chitinophaga sp. SYP-B3965]MRG44573.1 histidine kinase [Chitinophaga sp. SYP-B3965]
MESFLKKHALRVAITLAFVIVAWGIRSAVGPMSIPRHLLFSIPVIIVTQIIWTILAAIHRLLNRFLPFSKSLYGRVILQVVIGLVLVFILRTIVLSFLERLPQFEISNLARAMIATINNLVSLAVNMALIGQHFTAVWKEGVIKTERLEKEKVQLQYHQLKNQVDPHFLFNAFTSLDSLIKVNPDLASRFIGHLAKVYRYVLQNRDKEVVNLKTELDFLAHYIALLEIRFEKALVIEIQVDASSYDKGIAMVTLQMLIDNALKHNEVHPGNPLHISISEKDGYLEVTNNKQIRRQLAHSDKQGLEQLKSLYAFLSDRPVVIKDETETFTVALPLL